MMHASNRGFCRAAMIFAVGLVSISPVLAGTVYVSTVGNDSGDGLSWATAKLTVQAGLNAAAAGDQVWVAAGTYVQCITLKAGVGLYGGFAGGETELGQRDWKVNVTGLDGNQAGSVVTAPEGVTEATRIDGFTIRNGTGTQSGSYWYGGGIYCSSSSPTIANNTIAGNSAYYGAAIGCLGSSPVITSNTITGNSGSYGSGIYCIQSSPTIANNTILSNSASSSGGGICCYSSQPTISNNTIRTNSATGTAGAGYGGAIYCSSSTLTVANNTITGNRAAGTYYGYGGGLYWGSSSGTIANNAIEDNIGCSSGGGIYFAVSSPIVQNNRIAGNVASGASYGYGGGIYCASSSPAIHNNTISGNSATGSEAGSGGGIYSDSGASGPSIINNTISTNRATGATYGGGGGIYGSCTVIANTIVAFNSSGICGGTASLRNNCVYGNSAYNYYTYAPGDPTGTYGNISVDPRLDNITYQGSTHIQPNSPCIDAGDDTVIDADWTDMDGQARILGGHADIGADESDGTVWRTGVNVIVRVAPEGNDASDGSSWTLAKRTVQAGIDAAAALGGEVWVKAGTYAEGITLSNCAYVYGGFAGTESDRSKRDWAGNETILDGGQAGSVVTANGIGFGLSEIDGFTIRNGTGTLLSPYRHGGGIYCIDTSLRIANNKITGNRMTGTYEGNGGGIYCSGSNVVIANNAITSNASTFGGGGISWSGSSMTVTDNTITGNTGSGISCGSGSLAITNNAITGNTGDGISCASKSGTITQNTITSNNGNGISCSSSLATVVNNSIAGNGGIGISCSSSAGMIANNAITGNGSSGISCSSSSPTIANNTITGNNGGGISCSSSSPTIANNTIAGNSSSGISCGSSSPMIANNTITGNIASSGGGIYCNSSSPTIVNTIIASNSSGVYKTGTGTLSLRYNCVYANAAYNYSGVTDPTGSNGNLSVDPQVANLAYRGIPHIQPSSPCVDAGDDTVAQAGWTDVDGQARVAGAHVDIGADESDGTVWPSGPSAIIRVAPEGNDANNGSTWAVAKRTVQAGIDAAAALGGEVWIKTGTYVERITLRRYAHVYGGFAGTEVDRSARDRGRNATILDGGQGGSVVTATQIPAGLCTLDGLTIRNGKATTGGGISCSGASPTITNNTITGNTGTSTGGGISCSAASPTIANNTLVGNTASGNGGGVYCESSSAPTIANNTVTGNSASYAGGGVYCISSSSPMIVNNTITGNTASSAGGGICCDTTSLPTIANTIVAFNSSGIYKTGTGTPSLRYNCVYGNASYNYSGIADPSGSNGNISTDPKLGNFVYRGTTHIQPDSPCANAGDNALVQAGWTDMDGQARIQGTRVDIGADESDGTVWPSMPNIIVRVAPDGSDANDGSSWALAKRTVQAGIDAAAALGGDVWVKAGTYSERITLRTYAHVYGGFTGAEVDRSGRDWTQHATNLDGGQGGSTVTGKQVPLGLATIDGFTIRNGKAASGGGIYCLSASPTIANNTITGNSASANGGGIYCESASAPAIRNNAVRGNSASSSGGGIYSTGSWPAVLSNTITGNTASSGGGVYGTSSFGTIASNTIAENTASGNGGGICCSTSSGPMIASNVITSNSASSQGGGIYCDGSAAPTIANNTIINNSGTSSGGGIYCYSSSPKIVNSTIVGNGAGNGGGIYCSSSSATIANTLIAFNSSGVYKSGGTPSLRYNCVYGNGINYTGMTDPTGTDGNIAGDPKLACVVYGNIHLQPDSPCVDAGDDSLVQTGWTDMDGQGRNQGAHVDIGADESDGRIWPAGPYTVVRVRPVGDDANDGSSWALAKRTVQAGINAAAAAGGEVWVAAGTYQERITLRNGAHVYGGFAGSEGQRSDRDVSGHVTTLDGNQAGSVVSARQGGYGLCTIDGFTLRNGKASSGGGICCVSSSPTVARNTIAGNSASGVGGGVYCSSASPTIANNTITGNTAPSGAGVYSASPSAPNIVNSTITGNNASSSGGGIYCSGAAILINNTIAGNNAFDGGGIYCAGGSPTIVNTIIAFNSSGLYNGTGATPSLRYNCVYGSSAYNYSGLTDPTGTKGNICVDPRLAQPLYANVHVQPDSPCVDGGDDGVVQADWIDMDGQGRKQGSHVDIGADESDGTAWPLGSSVIVRVSPQGNDANDGSSWALAKRTVQAGINAAGAAGGQVWVAAGTYVEAVTLMTGVSLYGGFAGSETDLSQRNWITNGTILDGNKAGSVITAGVGVGQTSCIDGFTIRNGSSTNGGGIYCYKASPTIANNAITGNSSSKYGGGIYCYSCSPTISGNLILSNSSPAGGGIYCDTSSSPAISSNTITGNKATGSSPAGGGICCSSSSPTITSNTITGNSAPYGGAIGCYSSPSATIAGNAIQSNSASSCGGGIYCTGSSPAITSNTIARNNAPSGGAVYCDSGAARLVNNTITGNYATSGGGIYCRSASAVIANTIIAFNSSGIYSSGGAPTVRYNCVHGNTGYNYSGMTDSTGTNGNLSTDPKLSNTAYGNVHIQPDSPCIDAADDSAVQASWVDMDGQPRKQGAHVDIGADESNGTAWPTGPNVVIRVASDGNDTNDGLSWALPKRTVQAGIDVATAAGGEVWVKAGTYAERVTLRDLTYLYGGFAGTESERNARDWAHNETVLDGGQAGSVVTGSTAGNTLGAIDGFTIRNGNGTLSGSYRYGGGIYCTSGWLAIANNKITGNTAYYGGGIYCSFGSPAITNNTITGNSSSGGGGGIYCSNCSPVITGNVILSNSAQSGGGIYCESSSPPTVSNSTIARNSASSGGGIYCYSSSLVIVNVAIVGNTATGNGGGIFTSGSPRVANSTITGNSANGNGGGIYCSSASAMIANTIVAFNSSGIYKTGTATPSLRYNCVCGNTAYNYSGVTDPTGTNGNITADPRFVRAASAGADGKWGTADDDYGDLRLLPGSACVDAGSNADVPADAADLDGDGNVTEPLPFDLASKSRFMDDLATVDTGSGTAPIVDIGAYEYVLVGDINSDGHVNLIDLLWFSDSWAKSAGQAGFDPRCDFDGNGSVDVLDLLLLAGNWGK